MADKHVTAEPRKIHGDKLAEAFRRPDEVTELPRHPGGAKSATKGGWVSGGDRAERESV